MKITLKWSKVKSAMVADWKDFKTIDTCCSDCRLFIYHSAIFFLLVFIFLWVETLLMFVCGGKVGLVLSESVEHTFHRGDLLLVTKYPEKPIQVGDVVFFEKSMNLDRLNRNVTLAREVIQIEKSNGTEMFLVNYNNSVADRESESGKLWMTEKDIIGQLRFTLPHAGLLECLRHENTYKKLIVDVAQIVLSTSWSMVLISYPWTIIFAHRTTSDYYLRPIAELFLHYFNIMLEVILLLTSWWLFALISITHGMSDALSHDNEDDEDEVLPTSKPPERSSRFNNSSFMTACRLSVAVCIFLAFLRVGDTIIE